MENVKIYEIKQSAHENYLTLRSEDGLRFYWNDAKFINNEAGDYVFVVNKTGREALFTRLTDIRLNAVYDEDEVESSFTNGGDIPFAKGKWDTFLQFDILESRSLPPDWKWTTNIGTSETYDLWKANGDLIGQVNRIEKINDLRRIFKSQEADEILQQAEVLLNGGVAQMQEIVTAMGERNIQLLMDEQEFVYQKAADKLAELIRFQPSPDDNDFYQRLIDQVGKKKGVPFLDFVRGFPQGSDEYRMLFIIGELIAYCDAKGAGKQEFNQYPDKRTIAHSFVRQTIWVLSLLRYKEGENDINAISSSSIQNAISYVLDPGTGLPMLSEDHREMVARYLFQTAYDKLSFIQDMLRFFSPYAIRCANPANRTKIISDILYTPGVKKLWYEKVEGLVVADNTGWQEEAIEEMESHSKMVLWWNKLPSGGAEIQKRLREQIEERGFFYIYYARGGAAYCRSRIIDFATEEDYLQKNWNIGNDVGWYRADFNKYIEDDGGKKARIVFLANEVIKLETPIPYSEFEFYQDYQHPVQNNMQPYAQVNDDMEAAPLIEEVAEEAAEEEAEGVLLSPTTDKIGAYMDYRQLLMAAKTKPFVLLAGISGIGKSRLVRTLAFKSCAIAQLRDANPLNFLLIQVKPNWNDSTGLLGYESAISRQYKITPFMKFLVQAWRYPQIPFFLCLDEMNLAPVELYMAEYLSAIESRKYGGGTWSTDALIPADVFVSFNADEFWQKLGIPREKKLHEELAKYGLRIPPNLVIIGTVNMDETTHSFSRKVLDRAMTIEMNEVDLRQGLNAESSDLDYPKEFLSKELVCGVHTSAGQVFGQFDEREQVLSLLIAVNGVLDRTPFKIAYRVRDESMVYCYYHSRLKLDDNGDWLTDALDEIICMKVLSRIEGDETKCGRPLKELKKLFDERKLKKCAAKVQEMIDRLAYGYTSFFP